MLRLAAVAAAAALCGACSGSDSETVEAVEANAAQDTSWRLVWSDEFDGTELDAAKWTREVDCWGGGNDERQCYTDSTNNARVEDGHLIIEARLEEATGPALPERLWATEADRTATATQEFTSGRVNTSGKGDWRYGRVEVRARLPEGQGTWPAIWMLPTDEVYGGWALSGEIDIMEAVNLGAACADCEDGIENRLLGTLHFGGLWPQNTYQNRQTTIPTGPDGEQVFHTFAIEWTEGKVEWFLDGESYGYLTSDDWSTAAPEAADIPHAPFDQRFHLILNLAIGGNLAESHSAGGMDYEGYPKQFAIDWVRVYDCPADLETATACAAD